VGAVFGCALIPSFTLCARGTDRDVLGSPPLSLTHSSTRPTFLHPHPANMSFKNLGQRFLLRESGDNRARQATGSRAEQTPHADAGTRLCLAFRLSTASTVIMCSRLLS